jgi:hypothetical protein
MSEPHLITDSRGLEITTGEPENLDDAFNPQSFCNSPTSLRLRSWVWSNW